MATGPVAAASAAHASSRPSSVSTTSGRPSRSSSSGAGGGGGASSSTGVPSSPESGPVAGAASTESSGSPSSRAPAGEWSALSGIGSGAALPAPAGDGRHALGHRRQPDGGAHQLAPRLDVGGHVEPAVLVDVGGPRGADLDLGGAGLVGHPAEALGGDARDGAGRGVVAGAVGVERLDQPRPADGGQHRVGAELGIDVGAGVGHAAEGAVPGVVAGGVVKQDQPPGAEVLLVDRDVATQCR